MTVTACCLDTDFYYRQCVVTVICWPSREGTFVLCSLFMNLLLVFVNLKYNFAILSKRNVLLHIKRYIGLLHLSLYFITVFWLKKWQFLYFVCKIYTFKVYFFLCESVVTLLLASQNTDWLCQLINYIKIICFIKVNTYFNKCKSFVFKCIIK